MEPVRTLRSLYKLKRWIVISGRYRLWQNCHRYVHITIMVLGGWGVSSRCFSCEEYDNCGKKQETPVQVSNRYPTELVCSKELLKRLQDRHVECGEDVAKKTVDDTPGNDVTRAGQNSRKNIKQACSGCGEGKGSSYTRSAKTTTAATSQDSSNSYYNSQYPWGVWQQVIGRDAGSRYKSEGEEGTRVGYQDLALDEPRCVVWNSSISNKDCALVIKRWLNRVEEDESGLTFQEWTSDVDTSRTPVTILINSSELRTAGFNLKEVLSVALEAAARGGMCTWGEGLRSLEGMGPKRFVNKFFKKKKSRRGVSESKTPTPQTDEVENSV